jgi:hypothetical protein
VVSITLSAKSQDIIVASSPSLGYVLNGRFDSSFRCIRSHTRMQDKYDTLRAVLFEPNHTSQEVLLTSEYALPTFDPSSKRQDQHNARCIPPPINLCQLRSLRTILQPSSHTFDPVLCASAYAILPTSTPSKHTSHVDHRTTSTLHLQPSRSLDMENPRRYVPMSYLFPW